MKRMIKTSVSLVVLTTAFCAFGKESTFMPPNNLHLHPQEAGSGITQAQFNAVIDRAEAIYKPIIAQFGAKLSVNRLWNDNTVNASAEQPTASSWKVNMYGGLARRAEVTEDGFAMVLCHEIGHHLAGYPFVQAWAANEGQSDMHATGPCAAKLFSKDNALLSARAQSELPADMKAKCDANRPAEERDICYRSLLAGKSLADLLAALGGTTANFETPDQSKVKKTNNSHPAAQCRLDTYVASALCGGEMWDDNIIPGKNAANRNSLEAQEEAYAHSCETGPGARPGCWFAALTEDPGSGGECPFEDPTICDLLCQFDPSQPWCFAIN